MTKLEIPHSQKDHGVTPGSLRGSGASAMYVETENVQLICWRGRWSKQRALEYYPQEVAAQLLLHRLSPNAKSRIQELDAVSAQLVNSVIYATKN